MLPLHSAGIGFGILWTNGMVWWNSPQHAAAIAIMVATGALAGVVWFVLMRAFAVRFAKSR
jgi:hypothetical protein